MVSERMQRQIDRLLDEAEKAVEHHEWDVVLDKVQSVLGLDPENSDGLAYRAAAEREIGEGNSSSSRASQPAPALVPTTTPTTDQPTSFANGRYEVKRFLGEGGKKIVYLAHDSLLDRDVAFALIKTEGLDEISRTTSHSWCSTAFSAPFDYLGHIHVVVLQPLVRLVEL